MEWFNKMSIVLKKSINYLYLTATCCLHNVLPATTLTVLAPALDVEAIGRERVCQGRRQLSQNECVSVGVSDDECVSLSLDLTARNLASVTRPAQSINQLCSLQITRSYQPGGNFTLEHPAAQVWLIWWMMTLVCTLGFLAAFFFLGGGGSVHGVRWKWMCLLFH